MVRAALLAVPLLAVAQASAIAQTAPPSGRLLASNCFQCHGTNGSGGFDRLAGKSANELYKELREMARESDKGIMRNHALGYTDGQMRALADFLSRQSSAGGER